MLSEDPIWVTDRNPQTCLCQIQLGATQASPVQPEVQLGWQPRVQKNAINRRW